MYQYKAEVTKVVDADTLDCSIDLGFGISVRQRLRLARINAPERYTKEGIEATQFVKIVLESGGYQVTIDTDKQGKFGRWIADVFVKDVCLNDLLLAKGLAQEYLG